MAGSADILEGWRVFSGSDWPARLDRAQVDVYEQEMQSLRKKPGYKVRAEDSFASLHNGLTGNAVAPDYDDPFVAVSYLIEYQLSHCAMACAV